MHLELLVFDEDLDKEVFVPFSLEIEFVNGFYLDPADANIVNLISYGQTYSVKKSHPLMAQLQYKIN